MNVEDFSSAWGSLVQRWVQARGAGEGEADEIVRSALAEGLPAPGPSTDPTRRVLARDEDSLDCAVAVVGASGAFDAEAYRTANPFVADQGMDALRNYCERGWRFLRNPSTRFDGWHYWSTHMDPTVDRVDPLLHYLLVGRAAGLSPVRGRVDRPAAPAYAPGSAVRRACLFAGHDPDGVLDDTVLAYLGELGRFADVYYLADTVLDGTQLSRLAPLTRGAWGVTHRAHGMGSYSLLAGELVGWERLGEYDEVLFVNDSCYQVRPLDDMFATMDARDADWWGLHVAAPAFHGEGPQRRSVRWDDVAAQRLPRTVMSYDQFVGIDSSFWCLRRPVLDDAGFRRRLAAVVPQTNPVTRSRKYETGLTQYLVEQGHTFSTLLPDLHPFHPLFRATAFDLVADGFPLLKRQLLVRNPFDVPDLVEWPQRLGAAAPAAPVRAIQAHLDRVAADDEVQRSFAVRTRPEGGVTVPRVLTARKFAEQDAWTPTYDHWWAFPVCAYQHTFEGNARGVFEEVRDDPSIKKIVLTRTRRVDVDGANVVLAPMNSPEGQHHLMRSRHVFVKHGPGINLPVPLSDAHRVLNLWHGIPLKRFAAASVEAHLKPTSTFEEHVGSHAVITSSALDTLAMTAAFHPLTTTDMWRTGLPRNDFVLRDAARLPTDLREAEERLRAEVGGRRLLLLLPTYRHDPSYYYTPTPDEVAWLADWCRRHDAVVGIREHLVDHTRSWSTHLTSLAPLDLSSRRYPDVEVCYRVSDAMVTDYSSGALDFSLTGRPLVSFAHDLARYAELEQGLFYDLDQVFPGPVCHDFAQLRAALEVVFDARTEAEQEDYAWRRGLFFDHVDDQASWRVVQRVKSLYVRDP